MSEGFDNDISDEDLRGLEDPQDDQQRFMEAIAEGTQNLPDPLYRVKIRHSSETLFATYESEIAVEDKSSVVVTTRYGKDLGILLGRVKSPGPVEINDIVQIDRVASEDDLKRFEENCARERDAFGICQQKIASHGLAMKLVSTHYLLDEPKVLFFFTAESRVDFRELVKDLVSVFKMRIELRQIGVRDEARVVGGGGVCGRAYCCHAITDKLNPVSIKMAKDQNLSLNSMKISGPCGRLLCCLSYEFNFYKEERRSLPSEGTRFFYDGANFKVLEVNVLKGRVRMMSDDNRLLELPANRFLRQDGRWAIKPEEPVEKE